MYTTQMWLVTILFTTAALALPSRNLNARVLSYNRDLQQSHTLDPSLVQIGYFSDGMSSGDDAGKVASEISFNNFINYCATRPDVPLTNGQQVESGSCNATPMGFLAARDRMPHAKFAFPRNGALVPPRTALTLRLAVRNLATGHFADADTAFHAAPQQTDAGTGVVVGHAHVALQRLPALDTVTPLDPAGPELVFFKGLNAQADASGELSADIPDGLDVGFYRLASIVSSTNHQPALVAVAQRGPLDDMVYFEVRDGVDMPSSS